MSDFIEISGETKIYSQEGFARSWDVDLGPATIKKGNFFKECCNQVFEHHDGLPLFWAATFEEEHYVVFIGEDFPFTTEPLESLKDIKLPDDRVYFAVRWLCFRASVDETNSLLRQEIPIKTFQESQPLIVIDEDFHHDQITIYEPPDQKAVLAIGGVECPEITMGGANEPIS
jgi:hypothetical protein